MEGNISFTPQERAHLAGGLSHPAGTAPRPEGAGPTAPLPEGWSPPGRRDPRIQAAKAGAAAGRAKPSSFCWLAAGGTRREWAVTNTILLTAILGNSGGPEDSRYRRAASRELICIVNKFPTQKLSYSPSGSLYNFPEAESCQLTYPSLLSHQVLAERPPVLPLSGHAGGKASRYRSGALPPPHTARIHPKSHSTIVRGTQAAAQPMANKRLICFLESHQSDARYGVSWKAARSCEEHRVMADSDGQSPAVRSSADIVKHCTARLPCGETPAWKTHHHPCLLMNRFYLMECLAVKQCQSG